MFKFTTIYCKVDDEQMLEDFFSSTHLPLAEALPNLEKREISRVVRKPGGQSRYQLMFELYFQNETVFKLSLASPEGVKLVEALKPWAEAKIITWFFSESFEEDI
jgi:uncharacterized protein (TIGR02118 family)